jgi:hypothetical protein
VLGSTLVPSPVTIVSQVQHIGDGGSAVDGDSTTHEDGAESGKKKKKHKRKNRDKSQELAVDGEVETCAEVAHSSLGNGNAAGVTGEEDVRKEKKKGKKREKEGTKEKREKRK